MTSPGATTVGIDLGGTKCLGVVVDQDGVVLEETKVPTPAGVYAVLDLLVDAAERLLATEPGRRAQGRVGIGVPGLVDREGVLRFAPNLRGLDEVAVRADVEARLASATSVVVDNDVTCAAWGERTHGAARAAEHCLLVALGTGIGGGIVVDGRLLRGANGFAGEIGHVVVDPYGPRCPCGKRGCWERYASGTGLGNIARDFAHGARARRVVELAGGDPEAVRGEHVTRAAAEGDEEARAVLAEYAWWLALGLANLANVFDPNTIVLGGGLVEAGEILLAPTRQAFGELVEGADHRPPIDIVLAQLGERAGAVGAAALARTSP